MNANVNTQIDNMVDSKEERQKYIDRVEVLEKVKKLFLIPQLDMMTARQIADFYEVDMHTIQICYQRNKKEIDSDGTVVKKSLDFAKISKDTGCDFRQQAAVNILEFDNVEIVIPNRGVRCFSKRAVLRFGMLLRDSKVAQEVRTQLLNVFEHTETENPQALTTEIDNEQELLNNITLAYTTGNPVEILQATAAHAAYLKRHNEALIQENAELTEQNETLAKDNSILTGNILEWSNRASANKVVRLMAIALKWNFATTWTEIYNELNYRHSINLRMRQARDKKNSAPLLAYLHDDEWEKLYETIAAMLNARYVNPSKIFEKAKLTVE
jgi:hypothetical protein